MSAPLAPKPRDIAALDRPLADVEQEIANLRAHAAQHLAERGALPSPDHWEQWHAFFDIDPDLRGRDYTPIQTPGGAS